MNHLPWLPTRSLNDTEWLATRERAIFECFKWDQQVGDTATLARQPIVLRREAWTQLTALSEALARECTQAEKELITRPDLHDILGLPRPVRRALRWAARREPCREAARLIRFDFHFTTDGWQISEGNTDVPGGHNEADGYPKLMQEFFEGVTTIDASPVSALVETLQRKCSPESAPVALVHATSYSDDRQVMLYLERALVNNGMTALLLSPADLRWQDDRAFAVRRDGVLTPLGAIVRFFPGEWLLNLPGRCDWRHFFAAGQTPLINPATALLTQSKCFPLAWDRLETPLPTWRALLPETRTIRQAGKGVLGEQSDWIVKPALGRVGEGVAAHDLVGLPEWSAIRRDIMKTPEAWVAQRRFQPIPMMTSGGPFYPCIGVYTLDAKVAGAYGRLGTKAIVDAHALDTAVLIDGQPHGS